MQSTIVSRRQAQLILLCAVLTTVASIYLYATADATPTTETTRRLFGLWRARHVLIAGGLVVVTIGVLLAAISRSALLSYFTILLSTVSASLLLELAGFVGLVSWPNVMTPSIGDLGSLGTRRAAHVDVRGQTMQDTASAWGLRSEPVTFHYRTDRHGLRNEPDRSEADVYLLGDSMLVAALVPYRETIAARTERAIGRPVMQVALIGLAPQEEHQLFRDTKLNVRGKLVLQFIFEGNDLLDSRRFREQSKRKNSEPWTARSLSNHAWRLMVNATDPARSVSAMRVCTISGQTYTFAWAKQSYQGLESEATVITNAIEAFATEVRSSGGHFAVVFVPTKLRVLGPQCQFSNDSVLASGSSQLGPLRTHFQAWSKSSGIDVLDLTEPLQLAAQSGSIPWFWGDTHWNSIGHEVAANALGEWSWMRRLRQ